MASTYSDLKFELIGTGEQSGTWGVTTNTNIGTAIQEAITGSADVTFASGTVTLTLTNTNASQTARNLRLNLTGTSGGAQDLIVPTIEKFYLVNNGCADAITVKNSTGTGVAVPAGKAMLVFNNGTDVVDAVNHFNTASVGTLSLTNALAIAQGGTGATTADTALDNLGGTTTGKAVFKATDAAAGRTALGAGAVGGNVFTSATAAAAQQAMDTEVGVDVQAYDADLTAIAGLANTDGNFIVGNGSTWVAENGATARTSLGLGTLATLNEVDASTIQDNSVGAAELNVSGNGTAGQLLSSDGDGTFSWADAGGGGYTFTSVAEITQSGTWTSPANTSVVKVTCIGGGGGGQSPTRAGGSGGTSAANFGTGKNITSPGGVGGWLGSSFYEAPSAAFNAKPSITGSLYIENGLQTTRAAGTIHTVGSGTWGFGQSLSFTGSIGTAIYEVSPSTGYPVTVGGGGGHGGGNTNGNPGGTSGMAGGTFNGNSGNGGNGSAGGGGTSPGRTGATYNALNNGRWYTGPGNDLSGGSGGIVIIEY